MNQQTKLNRPKDKRSYVFSDQDLYVIDRVDNTGMDSTGWYLVDAVIFPKDLSGARWVTRFFTVVLVIAKKVSARKNISIAVSWQRGGGSDGFPEE